MARDSSQERQITTDPETIRSWGGRTTLVPVRYTSGGEHKLDVAPESETTSDHETLDWGEFHSELRDRNQVVVREGEATEDLIVADRSEIVGRVAIETEEVESALLEGETTETEFTERTVIEHTVVEEATVQSELVDREVVESEIVDAELLSTEVQGCTVSRSEAPEESAMAVERFQPGIEVDEAYDVEIDVEETWDVTRNVVERITIESRIVDTDVETEETVESDTIRERVNIEDTTETILEGELVQSSEAVTDAVESGHVESQFREDDTIETHLIRQQTIEEGLGVRKKIHGEIADGETTETEAASHTVVQSRIVDADEYGVELVADRTVERTETTEGTVATDRVVPTSDDEGKKVVNADGDEIGMVVDIEDDEMYVDPHPSITDRIRTALGWGDHDADTYPVDPDSIDRIEENRVVIGTDRER